MKKKTLVLFIIIGALASVIAISFLIQYRANEDASDQNVAIEDQIDDTEELKNTESYEEESEDAQINIASPGDRSFIGKWHADSAQAEYLYGNINLNIKDNNTWTGNITGESISGKWTATDKGISLESEYLNAELFYTDTGKLVMQDFRFADNDDPIIIVLKTDE